MADRFNLTAQLQLQAPTNTRQIVTQIRNQLRGINANVNVQANTRAIRQASTGLQQTARHARDASANVGVLNKNLSEAARRFGVITLATGTMLSFAQSVKRAVGEAIQFERELVKISQVTGKTVSNLSGLTREITRLSTSLGVSSSSLLETSRVLAQAGFSATKTRQALDILAKTTLGPTFDSITNTVEGAIAVLRQFRSEAQATGGDIKFLESTLDAINSVSKNFAVESSDLITVIRRVGGVFSAAGGGVKELIALFTSVRATTRESAETIATGLRTIFTRIQRTDTVNQLEQLGISLRDAQGQFVGAFEAVRRLSQGLSALDPRDYRFSEIVEQLGGFRQIGKVIPLIQQFTIAQDALNVAQNASGSVARDAITAQQSLAVQAAKVREEFSALVRQLADSETFRSVASGALSLASALIKIAEALEPVLPLLTSFLALKVGQGLAPGLAAIMGAGRGRRFATGGKVQRYARGGYVPGSGNRDTVPAMLMPGEFVIKKSSAKSLGPDTLNAMNNNRFNKGTTGKGIREELAKGRKTGTASTVTTSVNKLLIGSATKADALSDVETYGAAYLRPVGSGQNYVGENSPAGISKAIKATPGYKALEKNKRAVVDGKRPGSVALTGANKIIDKYTKDNKYNIQASSLSQGTSNTLEETLLNGVTGAIRSGVDVLEGQLAIKGNINTASALKQANIDQTIGNLFESVLTFAGAPYAGRDAANAPFDFPKGLGGTASKFPGLPSGVQTDAKLTYNADSVRSIINKVNNKNALEAQSELDPIITNLAAQVGSEISKAQLLKTVTQKKASGGQVDTVPALLTPGEFVINKKSAQKVGYGNLSNMNRTGVAKFNAGGVVRRYARGTGPTGATVSSSSVGSQFGASVASKPPDYSAFEKAIQSAVKRTTDFAKGMVGLTGQNQKLQLRMIQAQKVANPNITSTQALTIARQKIAMQNNKLAKIAIPLGNAMSKAAQSYQGVGVGKAAGNVRQSGAAIAGAGQQLNQFAGAAQSMVFLAGSATALASQFGGLDEVTEKAITETVGFTTSIVGITGTVLQMVTSLITSTAAETANTVASGANTTATGANTTATTANTAASTMFAAGVMVAVVAVTAVAAAFKYFAAQARAEADLLKKASQDQLKAIEEGTGSIDKFSGTVEEAAAKQGEAIALDAGSSGALGLSGGLGGAVTGAAIGAFLGPIGIAVGAALGGLLGALIGGFSAYSAEQDRQIMLQQKFGQMVNESATSLGELTASQRDFGQALKDIDEADLQPEERVSRRIAAQADSGSGNQQALAQANAQLQALADELGKPVAELEKADFKKFPQGAAIFENANKTISKATEGLAKDTAESRKTLKEAADLEITGDLSFDQVIAQGGAFAQALQASQNAIRAEAAAKLRALQAQLQAAKTTDEEAAIRKQMNDVNNRTTRQIRDQVNSYKSLAAEQQRQKKALEESTRAQEAYRKSLLAISQFTNGIVTANAQLDRLESELDSTAAIASNTAQSFKRLEPAGLSDLSQVGDRNSFERQVDAIAAKLGPQGQRLADTVKKTSKLIEVGQTQVIGKQFDPKGDVPSPDDLLNTLGLSEADFGPAFDKFQTDYFKAMKDGMLSEQEFNDLFAPVIDQGKASAEALKQGNDLINRQYSLYGKYVNQLQEQRDKEITARQSLIDVQNKNAELMAEAIGVDQTPEQKEAGRRRRAQTALQGIQDPRGRQVQAGNVQQIAAAKASIKAQREKIAADKEAGKITKEMIALDAQLASNMKLLDEELKRLSDQSEAAADIMAELDSAGERRETLKGVVEEFVAGDPQERGDMNRTFADLSRSIASGRLSQDPEQRKATLAMLDRLGDISLPGTGGLTGDQVKTELVMREAVNLGLSPEIARQLATRTTEEERLVTALDRLTLQMEEANRLKGGGVGGGGLFARGGPVQYRAAGGSMFKPKGTDTVPAMLTPGEFVIRKSAVDKIGVNNLHALNRSGGGPVPLYRANGGGVNAGVSSFVGQSQNISIMSGKQFKDALMESIRNRGVSGFIRALRKLDEKRLGNKFSASFMNMGAIRKRGMAPSEAALQLARAGKLDLSRLRVGNSVAKTLDNMIQNQLLFESAGAGGAVVKIPDPRSSIQAWQDSVTSLRADAKKINLTDTTYEGALLKEYGARNIAQSVRGIIKPLKAMHDRVEIVEKLLKKQGIRPKTFSEMYEATAGAGNIFSGGTFKIGGKKIEAKAVDRGTLGPRAGKESGKQTATDAGGLQGAINILRNEGLFFNRGGKVPSYLSAGGKTDTVPAMLTPGEFVMSKEAVAKHGLHKMRKLNRGDVKGFNKGGLVGGTQYLQDGGSVAGGATMISIDPSRVQGVFDNFLASFTTGFDNIVKSFSGVQNALTSLSNSLSNINMTHSVNVEGLITVGGLNLDAIKQELSSSIGQMVAKEVTDRLNQENRRFKAG